ncbi:acetylornithine deacetylase [Parvibaculum sp.]|uniref:acetylornithine deacetylase n=1 Tax=Parvibaculum sp. TaxID=2024848 RepID=UPI0027304E8D|nr:acetylornithine deacetylase [Parvibaculum sp.]MDP1626440.1 acetylornithine deacetylase [Parvibaculum sp.]MDP2150362.1 acetylornithine deacetylase [Parvibaculum sp.]MDP3327884.1 acetylornithine deacetylase [Parvibaculum sp.]
MSAPQRFTPREMIGKLVSFDTTSHLSNLALIEFVEAYLASHGVASRRVMNEDGTKANLFATLGPADQPGGIVLSGHTDVVPVEGQDWSSDPFSVVEREGKLFGRGTSDMKSFIAIALASVPEFLKGGPQVPVHFALSYDEEVGCLGVRPMIDSIIRTMPKPQVVIVGEPSSMKVVNAHKGIQSYNTKVTGLEFHSSQTHLGVSAIQYAAELISFLMKLAGEMRERGDASGRFSPPFTTISVGLIKGGTAVNIIPKSCSFLWEYRPLPDADPSEIIARFNAFAEEQVLPRMRAVFPGAQIETATRAQSPGLGARDGDPGETLVMKLAQCNSAEAVSYNTEAGLFQLADIPTVVCGPGDIAQAHKPDEFVELSQIAECERFMKRLADFVSGRPV